MPRGLKLQNYPPTKSHNSCRGYILLTLMLFFTLLAIAALAVLPDIAQQIKRDREEEMIHRGVQYTRAIQHYYKKFGRYPTRIEELESSNNLRFLRKRYKDPMAGDKDFKLLRMGDPALAAMGFGQGFGQGMQGAQALTQGGRPGMVGAPGGGVRPAGPGDANLPQVTGLPANAVQTVTPTDNTDNGAAQTESKTDESSSSSSTSASGPGLGGQVFGGGPIVGVASTSKAKSIREFNNKSHYNEWPFVYDPSSDRGGLLNMPTQPGMGQGFSTPGQVGGVAGQAPANAGPQGGQPTEPPNPPNMPPEQ
jgi:type II secretory pathway pseudopilin PulG